MSGDRQTETKTDPATWKKGRRDWKLQVSKNKRKVVGTTLSEDIFLVVVSFVPEKLHIDRSTV